jgi:hypothetical protein
VRFGREPQARESVVAGVRSVLDFLRSDSPSRALVQALVGLNFFVIPVLNIGVALRAHQQGWSAQVLGLLIACIGVGAALGTMITLRIRPRHPMRFALSLLVVQGLALGLVGLLPMVGTGVALGVVGLTAGLASPMMAGTAQAIVPSNYVGRVFAVVGFADDALIPFALVGYGLVADRIGLTPTTVICGIGMMVLMGLGLLRKPLRDLRLEELAPETEPATQPDDPTLEQAHPEQGHLEQGRLEQGHLEPDQQDHGRQEYRQVNRRGAAGLPGSRPAAYEPAPVRRGRTD